MGVRDPQLCPGPRAAAAAGPAGRGAVADLPGLRVAVPGRGWAGERGHRGWPGHPAAAGQASRGPGRVLLEAALGRGPGRGRTARSGHRRLAADGWHRDAAGGRECPAGRGRGRADQPVAGRGHRARHGQRPARRGKPAGGPGPGRGRVHRGGRGRVRPVPARGGGAAIGPAGPAARRVRGHPAAHRAGRAPAGRGHLVGVLERPGRRGQPAARRVDRGGAAAAGHPAGQRG